MQLHHRGLRRTVLATTILSLLTGLAIVPLEASPAIADVYLNCGGSDQRDAVDRLPRPGVVVVDSVAGPLWYEGYTIGEAGGLYSLFIDSDSYSTPVVSVWENGTDCNGDEYSRNAWAVGPTGTVWGDSQYSGPPAYNHGDASGLPLNRPSSVFP